MDKKQSPAKKTCDRTIAMEEVRKWFESFSKPWPNDDACREVAAKLTKMKWPMDPPELVDSCSLPSATPPNATPGLFSMAKPANALLAVLPAHARHWRKMVETSETKVASAAVVDLPP